MGDLVHNNESLDLLNSKNMHFVHDKEKRSFLKKITNQNSVIVFPAHGCDVVTLQYAKKKFKYVYELTCPYIKNIIKVINKLLNSGKRVAFYGIKDHAETRAILSTNKNIQLVNSLQELNKIRATTYLVNQSTTPINEIKKAIDKNKNIIFIPTTCSSVKIRHNNILKLHKNTDLLFVIGDQHSNNTMTLCRLAKTRNIKTKLVSSRKDLNKNTFKGIETCALISGTSTPKQTVDEIINKIKQF